MEPIKPNLRTPREDFSAAEKAKLATNGLTLTIHDVKSDANLGYQFRTTDSDDLSDVAEVLAKSYGIYLEYDRAKTGSEKDWMYMLRITIPGGGPISREQWSILDDVASRYTSSASYTGVSQPSLRITSRQNIQMHWVDKVHLVDAVREIAESGFYTINGCGDNVRNVMGCPLSYGSRVFDANAWAQRAGRYFRLPTASYLEVFAIDPNYLRTAGEGDGEGRFAYGANLLNRKFKIAFSAVHAQPDGTYAPDNCVEIRTNDIGVAPILDDGSVRRFQVYIGGSQGERNGQVTFSALGQPFGVFNERDLLRGLDAIVEVHRDWGDRHNRHWARMKYVLYKMGVEWYRAQVREANGVDFGPPDPDFDHGPRDLHHGWIPQANDRWAYGAFIENGRIIDGPNGRLKEMMGDLFELFPIRLFTTPNQDLLFAGITEEDKPRFEATLREFGYGTRGGRPYSRLRALSGACVGRDTCRLTYTDSEKFEPHLLDALEPRWGDLAESIGVTGCERQCSRPATKTIGWVGTGLNLYMLKIGGTEDGRHQGGPLVDPRSRAMYLRTVPRDEVAAVTNALFEFYVDDRTAEEARLGGMGYFFRRVGAAAIIERLREDPRTAHLMRSTWAIPEAMQHVATWPPAGSPHAPTD